MGTITPEVIKKLRVKKGISQHKLAADLDLSRFRLSMYECGYGQLDKLETRQIKTYLTRKKNADLKDNYNLRGALNRNQAKG